jgi:hypothetical protein
MPTGKNSEKQANQKKWRRMNQIVERIRLEGPQTCADIKGIFTDKSAFSQSTLQNYLEELVALHLLTLKDGRYELTEHCQSFSSEKEYSLAIMHSKKLLRTLTNVLPVFYLHPEWYESKSALPLKTQEQLSLIRMCNQHFRTGYTDIYDRVAKLLNFIGQRNQLTEKLKCFDPKVEDDHLVEYLADFEIKEYAVPKKFRREVERLVSLLTPEEFITLKEIQAGYVNTLIEVSKLLSELTIKVEHGQPLLGKCELCPKVIIKESP